MWKVLRMTTWVSRFINNCRRRKGSGPLTTSETKNQINQQRLDLDGERGRYLHM